MLRVTLDSNVLDGDRARMEEACEGLAVEIATTTVTVREHGGRSAPASPKSPPVYESFVFGESRFGMAAFASEESPALMDAILLIIGSGSFPKRGERDNLPETRRRQFRDAMILEAHVRERRDVLVSNDLKAFGREKRAKLEALCGTRIMTVDEFCESVSTLAIG